LAKEGSKYPQAGRFDCKGCGAPLYPASTKFDSGCGWPAFYDCIPGAVTELPDADGYRIEIRCSTCGSHLGHTFKGEGFKTPTNERHCVNGVCLKYVK
jgi:peptide-methionine (R)-S-oxide reductase